MWNNNVNAWKNKTNVWQGKMNIWYLLHAWPYSGMLNKYTCVEQSPLTCEVPKIG